MTTVQLNEIKKIIGTITTLHGISRAVRKIIDCHDPLDWNGENEILDNESIAFDWKNEDGITEGVNIIFEIVNDEEVLITGVDTI